MAKINKNNWKFVSSDAPRQESFFDYKEQTQVGHKEYLATIIVAIGFIITLIIGYAI